MNQTLISLQPDALLAWVWLRLGWGVVVVALWLTLARRWPSAARLGRPVALLLALSMWLPGAASPTWWLGLAFLSPSLLLVALCALAILDPRAGQPQRPLLDGASAATLVLAAAVLYLSIVAVLPNDVYRWGTAPLPFAVAAAAVAIGWLRLAQRRGRPPLAAFALCAALLGYALLRLPTGNAWDAVLDPWLALWAVWALASRAVGRVRRRLPTIG